MSERGERARRMVICLAAFALLFTACQATSTPLPQSTATLTAISQPIATLTPSLSDLPSPTVASTPTITPLSEVDGYIRTLNPGGYMTHLALSANSKLLAASYQSLGPQTPSGVAVWDLDTGKQLCTFPGDLDDGPSDQAVALSPSGATLLVGGHWSRTVRLWDVATCSLSRTVYEAPFQYTDSSGGVWSVAWSPNSTIAAVGWVNDQIQIWDMASDQLLYVLDNRSDNEELGNISFSHDGTKLVNVKWNQVTIWDPIRGRKIKEFVVNSERTASNPVPARCIKWSPDGSMLALLFTPATNGPRYPSVVVLADAATGEVVREFNSPDDAFGENLAWSPDGTRLAGILDDNSIIIWDAATGAELLRRHLPVDEGNRYNYALRQIEWSLDGAKIAAINKADAVLIDTGRLLAAAR